MPKDDIVGSKRWVVVVNVLCVELLHVLKEDNEWKLDTTSLLLDKLD